MKESTKKKLESIDKSKIKVQESKDLLAKIEKALNNDKNEENQAKAEKLLDVFIAKAKAKNADIFKTEAPAKPKTPTQKKQVAQATKSKLDALMDTIANDPLFKDFNSPRRVKGGGRSDALIDSERKARESGRRVSQKGWKNQYGKSKGGRRYYEYRENRIDRKAPNYGSRPWLEDGGLIHPSDKFQEKYSVIEIKGDGSRKVHNTFPDFETAMVFASLKRNVMPSNTRIVVEDDKGTTMYRSFKSGGQIDESTAMVLSQNKAIAHHTEELKNALSKNPKVEPWVVGKIERASTDISDVTHYLDGRNEYAQGGYMAKGGITKDSIKRTLTSDTSQYFLEKDGDGYILTITPRGAMNSNFWHKFNVKELPNDNTRLKYRLSPLGYAQGGYMADDDYEKGFESEKTYLDEEDFAKIDARFEKEYLEKDRKSGVHDKFTKYWYNGGREKAIAKYGEDESKAWEEAYEDFKDDFYKMANGGYMANGGEVESEPLDINESVYFEVYDNNGKNAIIKFKNNGSKIFESLLIGNVKAGNRNYMSYLTKNDLKSYLYKDFDVVDEVDEDYVNDLLKSLYSSSKRKSADILVVKYPYPEYTETPDTFTLIKDGEQVFDYDPNTGYFDVVSRGLSYPDQIELDDFLENSRGVSEREYTPKLIDVIEVIKQNRDINEIVNELKNKGLIKNYMMADGGLVEEIKMFDKYNYPSQKTKGDKVRAIFEHFKKKGYSTEEINTALGKMNYAKGGEIEVSVGDKVKSKSGVDGVVYESTGTMFKLEDKYGNKSQKWHSSRDFKPSEITKSATDAKYDSLKGKSILIYFMGVKTPMNVKITGVTPPDTKFSIPTLVLETGKTEERIEGKEKINKFLNGEQIEIYDGKEYYAIELETKAKSTTKNMDYTKRRNLKLIVIKNPNKNGSNNYLTIDKSDFLNGLHKFEEGGNLSKEYTYIKRADVNQVVYRDSNNKDTIDFKPKNGFWVSKKALVEAGMNETKAQPKKLDFGTTSMRKTSSGWIAKNKVSNYMGYDWEITTMKSMRGDLVSTAVGGKNEKSSSGYTMFTYVMYQDPNVRLITSKPSRITEKVTLEQQEKALKEFETKVTDKWYAKGGKIVDQYEGRTAEDIWNNLDKSQRQHFLYDHAEEIEEYRGEEYGELKSQEIMKAYNSDWSGLDKHIRNRFSNHVRQGEYAKGGKIGFEGLSNKVAKNYEGKKVAPKYRKEYGETYDKKEAKEVGDKVASKVYRQQLAKMEKGGKLPEDLGKYFIKTSKTKVVEMSDLKPLRARPTGIENAEKYMRMAYEGKMEKRKPITIYKSQGKYRVYDGNSTYAVAKANGWEKIWAEVIKNPNMNTYAKRGKDIFTRAKEIRKEGEAWKDALQRAKAMK